ncbi:MAG: 2-iminoacetate synthase ThiH [Desulfomonilaceae bacterium]
MEFSEVIKSWPESRVRELILQAKPDDVKRALQIDDLSPRDLAALLSPVAASSLEEMARLSNRVTRRHFGRTIVLYAPIYLSNVCTSDCIYCGYATRSGMKGERRTLKESEIHAECRALAAHGFQNVLLLTGDAPRVAPVEYMAKAVIIAREYFASVSAEVYALDVEGYQSLADVGLEGVTLYMETYHKDTYAKVHLKGRKKDFDYRLAAIERAGLGGVRRLGIGALLGLYDWRIDGFWTALHAKYLQKKCWQSAVSVSFPRLLHMPNRYQVQGLPSDREFVQLILAMRLFLPEVGFNLSTRERADLRDGLIPLGVTHMSAGSSTRPGGYASCSEQTLPQFEIEDRRTPAEVVSRIRSAGYDPVWKDFDRGFHGA